MCSHRQKEAHRRLTLCAITDFTPRFAEASSVTIRRTVLSVTPVRLATKVMDAHVRYVIPA